MSGGHADGEAAEARWAIRLMGLVVLLLASPPGQLPWSVAWSGRGEGVIDGGAGLDVNEARS